MRATNRWGTSVENFESLLPVDELQSNHHELSTVDPIEGFSDLEQIPDRQREVITESIISGVTNEELRRAFEGWTLYPEELGIITSFLDETRLRESHPDWFLE